MIGRGLNFPTLAFFSIENMKKPERTYTISIEPGGNSIIGIPPGHTLSIKLIGNRTSRDATMTYSAPIGKIHTTLARWHQKEHPTGKKRRRFITHSDQLKNFNE